jgi:exosortase A
VNAFAPAWRQPFAAWLLLAGLLLASQWSAVSGMASIWWRSDSFAHAMLVPPLAAWLVWRDRSRLAALSPRPSGLGLLLLLAAVLFGLFGELIEANVVQHFGVVFSLQALTLALFGATVVRRLAFPLLFLLFAPPFGDFLTEPMMVWTADFTVSALRLSGIPVFREGLQFVIPSGNWSVVEACSGTRYLAASFMVGTLFAYLNFASLRKRLAFVAVSLLVPIVANWLRAYLIVMLGHHSGNTLAVGADHLVYGWVFFGIVMMIMFTLGARSADAPSTRQAATPTRAGAAALRMPWWPVLAAALVLLLPSQGVRALRVSHAQDPGPMTLPAQIKGWQQTTPTGDLRWNPTMLGTLQRLRSEWQSGAAAQDPVVRLDVGFWAPQAKDAKALAGTNVLVPSSDARWARDGQRRVEVDGLAMEQSQWTDREATLGQGGHWARRLYWVDGRFTASEREASLLAARQQIAGRGDAAALIVFMTGAPDGQGGEARLDAFWRDIRAPLNERLQGLASKAAGHNARP